MQDSKPSTRMLAVILAALGMVVPFSIDTYLPAFPAIAREFEITPLQVQQTLSAYFIPLAVMILFHGTLSDSFGRRPVILANLALFTVATLGCALARDFTELLIFRAVQGFSGGAGILVGRAIIRDLFDDHTAQRLMSVVTMIFGIAPAIGPVIGGWLDSEFGWRAVFVFLAGYAAITLAACWHSLPETHPPAARHPFAAAPLAANYVKLSRSFRLQLLSLAVAFNFAGSYLYGASAPAIIYDLLGLKESQFAVLFIPGILGFIFGAYLSGRAAGRMSPRRTVRISYLIMFGAAAFNVLYHALEPAAVPWTILPFMVYGAGVALAMPSLTLLAFDLFPANRGMTLSLLGFAHSAGCAITAGLIAPLVYGHGATLALGMMAMLILGWVSWMIYLHFERRSGPRAGA